MAELLVISDAMNLVVIAISVLPISAATMTFLEPEAMAQSLVPVVECARKIRYG